MSVTLEISLSPPALLLTVPHRYRARAKSIAGYQWNPGIKKWSYPAEEATAMAIVAEFGSELQLVDHQKTLVTSDAVVQQYLKKIEKLEKRVASLTKKAASVKGKAPTQKDVTSLQITIARQKELIDALTSKASSQAEEIAALTARLAAVPAATSQDSLASAKIAHIKELARCTSGYHAQFANLIDSLPFSGEMVISLYKAVEARIRRQAGCLDRSKHFVDLLFEAKEDGRISDDVFGLVQSMRRQRNIIAHEHVDDVSLEGRAVFVLLAAALVWAQTKDVV